ncbi:glycosyltransferase [Polynucleobacter sp. MWH-Svant-W18]|uniref:glycosyltransferase n=1 Tax=Polynucleobacter sp. MWH-Svant-W18 TaxID=1855909 RepID=UPI001BFEC288|nr:glycosyltransferase [Polynucleobacter sp. MWH-Svant-W18]QWD78087.1 hypothetical protein C2757_00575 [Polynucleobacter sp. MWH-Svant-W18]
MENFDLPIRIICATRIGQNEFLSKTATGKSIKNFINVSKVEVRLYANNSTPLGILYNQAIEESKESPAILIFMHDDIWLGDYFWAQRIRDGLSHWDIIGLAGNKRRVSGQPSWAFVNDKFQWDEAKNLSGAVGHGNVYPPMAVTPFGPINQECKLMDGLFLGVKSETLLKSGLRFDEQFKFHFYDLDFCRQAEVLNLKMGTIGLAVAHESGGNFNSDAWKLAYQYYLHKWKE